MSPPAQIEQQARSDDPETQGEDITEWQKGDADDTAKAAPKAKKRKVKAEKQSLTPNIINTWQKVQDEAHSRNKTNDDQKTDDQKTDAHVDQNEPVRNLSYSDTHPDYLICLLCRVKFSTMEQLIKHEHLSEMHAKNLRDEKKVAFATQCLKNIGKKPNIKRTKRGELPYHRELAKERRKQQKLEENRPKFGFNIPSSKKWREAPKPKEEENTTPAPMSKGAALLAKSAGAAGWKMGQRLGAQGQGIKNPIIAKGYTGGAGLGATGESTEGLSQKEIGKLKAKERMAKIV
jgi:G-patch domain